MLWDLSLSDADSDRRIIPIFLNENFILRPIAGKRVMDAFLNPNSRLRIKSVPNISAEDYSALERASKDFAYSAFVDLKEKHLQKNEETYNKYMYALKLRTEAADQIGVENIRKSRLARLAKEKELVEENYRKGRQVFPDFRMILLVKLEA